MSRGLVLALTDRGVGIELATRSGRDGVGFLVLLVVDADDFDNMLLVASRLTTLLVDFNAFP